MFSGPWMCGENDYMVRESGAGQEGTNTNGRFWTRSKWTK